MEVSQLFQSPTMRKISNSTLNFRQLIQSLRNNARNKKETLDPSIQQPPSNEGKDDSTLIASQPKVSSQNNNFLILKESDEALKAIPKVSVGDRDKLKKISFTQDVNPEIELIPSKSPHRSKLDISIQLPQQPSKEKLNISLPKVNAATQCQSYDSPQVNISYLHSPRNEGKSGQIIKQKLNKESSLKVSNENQKKIRDIREEIVLEYMTKETKLSEKSDPSQIFSFFTNLCLSCDIIIKNPSIKKFKNCIYYGFPIDKEDIYQGFLLFYDSKIYYGQFLNGYKHGLGVELHLKQQSRMKGEFKEGKKTGKFYVEKPLEKYIGFLENGLYHGEGRLTTQNYIYEGLFEKGQKNGYGEEFYPKTGIRLAGTFKNGVLEKSKASKSIPELRSKTKFQVSKEKQKNRLDLIRKRSLEKHNKRMNKIRERSQRQSEYEMQFNMTEEYYEAQPPKMQINTSRLEMYRQPLLHHHQKLPKICQEFEFCSQSPVQFESINTNGEFRKEGEKLQIPKLKKEGLLVERSETYQFQEPLPTPCLTVLRGRK